MYKTVHWLSWIVAFAMLLHSLYFWGGVVNTPVVGPQVLDQALHSIDSMGTAFYAQTGGSMVGVAGADGAVAYAGHRVGFAYAKLPGERYNSASIVRDAMTGLPKTTHYGTPIAFLIAILLYWRRPKPLENLKP